MPSFPVNAPRSSNAWMSPSGVTRLRAGEGGDGCSIASFRLCLVLEVRERAPHFQRRDALHERERVPLAHAHVDGDPLVAAREQREEPEGEEEDRHEDRPERLIA